MVGFKSIWLLFTLLLFAACVPQTKQTECGSNEAFNASLRTCVPVVNGPSSFIDIQSFSPTVPLVKGQGDGTSMSFSIVITNPYAQSYTVVWERIFNGITYSISPTSPTMHSFTPASLGSQLGTHVVSVKIKDSSNNIVDSHNFTIVLNAAPKPVIQSATVTPALYSTTYNPAQLPVTFSFTSYNNLATMGAVGNYRTDWTIYRSGVTIDTETDIFTDVSTTGSNYPAYVFDPNSIDGITVGDYIVRARLTNTAAEVVAEQQWSVTVQHPPLSKVTAREIYSAGGVPFSTISTAFNNTPYSTSTSYNFIPTGQVTQGDYCVTVASGEGTYASDGYFVRVDWYLDGATLVYSGLTTAGDPKVCLSDAPALVKAGIAFVNATTTAAQTHTLVARVVDEATGNEYTGATSDTMPGLGSYPFTWSFNVKPVNAAPTLAFSSSGIVGATCSAAVGTTKNCTVVQGTPFTLGINAVDDFYSTSSTTDSVQQHITYSMTLYRGATAVSTCSKTSLDVSDGGVAGSDYVGPDYHCVFTAPTYDANGSIHPTADSWSVSISVADDGSPISGSSTAQSVTYTYSLNVTEYSNPAGPTISAQGTTIATDSYIFDTNAPGANTSAANTTDPLANHLTAGAFVTENDTLNFNVRVADAEMDDYKILIERCTVPACTSVDPTPIYVNTLQLKTDNAATKVTTHTWQIPENLVPVSTAFSTNVPVYFKVSATDQPDVVAGVTTSSIMSLNIRNYNVAPVVTTASENPSSATIKDVVVGYPFSIDPGPVSDASSTASEATLAYQWYVSPDNTTFTAIDGATSRILTWTPSSAYGATAYLRMCATDGTAVYPLSGNFAGVCTGTRRSNSFQINIINNQTSPNVASVSGPYSATTGAVWYDTVDTNVAYAASVELSGGDYYINVSKLVRNTTTFAWSNAFENVRFKALQAVVSDIPTNLSIAGTANSLYIAYKCAPLSSPSTAKACIRRIEKGYTTTTEEKTNLVHKGKFGFAYAGITITENDAAAIAYTAPIAGNNYVIDFSAAPTPASTVTINGKSYTADGNANNVVDADEFCSSAVPGCTAFSAATRLALLVSESTDSLLQGVTARVVGDDVHVAGMKSLDSFDSTITVGQVGKILVAGGRFHLPVINQNLAGSNQNKISIIDGAVDTHLSDLASTSYNQIDVLNMDRAASFQNDIDDVGHMSIAMVSLEPSRIGQGRLFRIQNTGTTFSGAVSCHGDLTCTSPVSLFGGDSLSNIRLAGSRSSNVSNYIVAYSITAGKWKIGRYNESSLALSNTSEQDMEDLTPNVGTGADDVIVTADVQDIQIVADPFINGEARLAVSNFGSTVTDGFYLLRFSSTNSLSCPEDSINGVCTPFSIFTTDVNSRVYLSNIQQSVTLGTAGNTAAENTTDIVHAWMFPAAPTSANPPRHIIMNSVPESIHGTDLSSPTGTSGWRPPYVK